MALLFPVALGLILFVSLLEGPGYPLAEHVAGQECEPVAISAVTASELLNDVHRAADPQRRAQQERFAAGILTRFPVVEFVLEAARMHARLWADLLGRGEAVGAHDLIIGANAIAMEFQVTTVNVRDFRRIPGLRVQIWEN